MNFESLEKKVSSYNKLPDQDKIGENYKKIKTSINSYRKKLKVITQKIDNPEKYMDNREDQLTDSTFLENINKIEKLKEEINQCIDNTINIDKLVSIYLELYQLSNSCKLYLENKQMNIHHLDK